MKAKGRERIDGSGGTLQMVGDACGRAIVVYKGRIFPTTIEASRLWQALASSDSEVRDSRDIEGLVGTLDARLAESFDGPSREVDRFFGRPSILKCAVGDRSAISVVGGAFGRRLYESLKDIVPRSGLRYFQFLQGRRTEHMLKLFQSSYGFPAKPKWFEADRVETGEEEERDIQRKLQSSRIVVFVGESSALWDLESVIDCVGDGTPILPISFFPDSVQVGPLILGGNTSAFLLSRLGEPTLVSEIESVAVSLLSLDAPSYDADTSSIARQVVQIYNELPDDSCFSIIRIRRDNTIRYSGVGQHDYVSSHQLRGRLWSIRSFLRDDVDGDLSVWQDIAAEVQRGALVSIDAAFQNDFAAFVHESLNESNAWKLHEEIHPFFFFHHHNIYDISTMSASMLITRMIFASAGSVEWASYLVGIECDGPVQQAPSWYMPGDQSTPHSDILSGRRLAFVWHLTKDWNSHWGGNLVWIKADSILPPSFNRLHLFDTRKGGSHFVSVVTPSAVGKRLCWNGWWCSNDEQAWVESDQKDHVRIGDRFESRDSKPRSVRGRLPQK